MDSKLEVTAPLLFQELVSMGCLSEAAMHHTSDGFWAVTTSVADMLARKRITTFRNDENQPRRCRLFFDDWYLYVVIQNGDPVCGLFKMREEEHDAEKGLIADGDTPGVTVSFIAFDAEILKRCLLDPSDDNRKALNVEINRVVAKRGQRHHKALKDYFIRPQAEGPYLIAELYVSFLASLARDGYLAVPRKYAAQRRKKSGKQSRLSRFLDANNDRAGYTVCDHVLISIRDRGNPTIFEKYALLATHTADTSFHAFAAEVRYHACFLTPIARIRIPFLRWSPYDSAIRADLTIEESELEGPAPFHNPNSRWVRLQKKYHSDAESV